MCAIFSLKLDFGVSFLLNDRYGIGSSLLWLKQDDFKTAWPIKNLNWLRTYVSWSFQNGKVLNTPHSQASYFKAVILLVLLPGKLIWLLLFIVTTLPIRGGFFFFRVLVWQLWVDKWVNTCSKLTTKALDFCAYYG